MKGDAHPLIELYTEVMLAAPDAGFGVYLLDSGEIGVVQTSDPAEDRLEGRGSVTRMQGLALTGDHEWIDEAVAAALVELRGRRDLWEEFGYGDDEYGIEEVC